jgi:hypothetical protein
MTAECKSSHMLEAISKLTAGCAWSTIVTRNTLVKVCGPSGPSHLTLLSPTVAEVQFDASKAAWISFS